MKRAIAVGAVLAALAGLVSCSQPSAAPHSKTSTAAGVPGHIPAPAVVASGLHFPVNLTFDSHGGLWFTSNVVGGKNDPTDGVWYIPPGGRPRQVVTGLVPAGLVWVGNRLYVASTTTPGTGRITVLEGFNGSRFTSQQVRLDGLTVGQHLIGSIAPGPDGHLYIGTGAAGNSGPPGNVLSFAPDGGSPVVKATGLRSAFGLAFYGRLLLVTDTGRDDLGPFRPPEKLNELNPAGPVVNFGYPGCYGQGGSACAGTRPPLATFPAHATPAGIAVKGDVAFVAENGSSFLQNPSGSDIQRVDLRTGQHTVFWRSPVKHDPVGAAIGPDGNLYITLLASGEILRFTL